jgi:hypothetical protein
MDIKKKSATENALSSSNKIALTVADSLISMLTVVPPLETGKAIYSTYSNYRAQFFNEKLELFINQSSSTSKKQKDKFIALLNNDRRNFLKECSK